MKNNNNEYWRKINDNIMIDDSVREIFGDCFYDEDCDEDNNEDNEEL